MEVTRRKLEEWINRHMSEEPDAQSEEALQQWADESDANREFLNLFDKEEVLEYEIEQYKQIDPALGYSKFISARRAKRTIRRIKAGICTAVAAIIAIVFVNKVLLSPKLVPAVAPIQNSMPAQAVLPGSNKAILTLANGKTIILDSIVSAKLPNEAGQPTLTVRNRSLEYQQAQIEAGKKLAYNILQVPRTGYYQLSLPDGTKAWVNSMSSLRYPVAFKNDERRVYLSGEAYFEIAKDPSKPFIVQTTHSTAQVLGTSFNFRAYADEAGIQATVVEGSISVNADNASNIVSPNQQLQLDSTGHYITLAKVAAADVVSWKNGFFYFGEGAPVETVIRQIARWYDVEAEFPRAMPVQQFSGKIDRTLTLQDIIKYLERNQIHCRLEGRKLTILPS